LNFNIQLFKNRIILKKIIKFRTDRFWVKRNPDHGRGRVGHEFESDQVRRHRSVRNGLDRTSFFQNSKWIWYIHYLWKRRRKTIVRRKRRKFMFLLVLIFLSQSVCIELNLFLFIIMFVFQFLSFFVFSTQSCNLLFII
jgi:hypothetical protein